MSAELPPAGWYPDPSGAPTQRYFDGARWTEQYTPGPTLRTRSGGGRRGQNRPVHVVIGLLIALGAFAAAAAFVIYERTGTPARVTVTECHPHSTNSPRGVDCTGVWSPDSGPTQTVTIDGANYGDVGHTINVHVHSGNAAITTEWDMPALFGGIGVVFVVGSAITAVLVRRQR